MKPWIEIRITATEGSAPRDVGTTMWVSLRDSVGTIGGGALEYRAMDMARQMLQQGDAAGTLDLPLGPEIGQCCGGRVKLTFRRGQRGDCDTNLPSVYVFGVGHVGGALLRQLKALPIKIHAIDERKDYLQDLPEGIIATHTPLPEAVIAAAPAGAAFIVMTHDHGQDFAIAAAALARGDAAYVGMIGSTSKRGAFENWHRRENGATSAALTCPIGAAGLGDKRPAVIAVHVAAEVMNALNKVTVCPE